MKKILILISIMFLTGCVYTFNVEKANTYLLSHPDRPAQIKEAISVGEVFQGMNEEEVTLCMGKPDVVTTSQSYPLNTTMTTWAYLNRAKLKRTFIIFKDGAVVAINVSTQKGTVAMPYINNGPVVMPYPRGAFNSDPIISPSHQNVIVSPRPIIINPPVVKKKCSK